MGTTIRILLYEDSRDLREGMGFLLQATPGLTLVGAFPDTGNLEMQIPGLKPDVVLMDIDMPGRSGLDATLAIKALRPETQILMLTVFEDEDLIFQAIRNGASGYLLKRTSPTEVLAAIFDVYRGGSPMTSSVARKVLQFFQQQAPPASKQPDYGLSNREQEILSALVSGLPNKQIAEAYFISIETVRTHIRHIYEKLQVNSKTEVVLKVLKDKMG